MPDTIVAPLAGEFARVRFHISVERVHRCPSQRQAHNDGPRAAFHSVAHLTPRVDRARHLLACWIVLLLCLLLPGLSLASSLHFRHLDIAQGLAQSSGNAIAQGPRGLLWLGTEAGLQRYDGYDFVYYHHVPGDPTSLSQDQVLAIAFAKDGSLWVATDHGGLNRLKPDRSGFEHFAHDRNDPGSLASDQLHTLLLDRQGQLWVAGSKGVDALLPDHRFRHYGVGDAAAHDRNSYALLQDAAGRLWVGSAAGLLYLDASRDTLRHFEPATGSDPAAIAALRKATVHCLMQSHDGRLWVGTTDGLFVLSTEHRIEAWLRHDDAKSTSLADDHVTALVEDRNGTVWVGMGHAGLDRLDPSMRGWAFLHARHDKALPDSLSSDQINTLFTDATGLVWIGTYSGGFDIYNPRSFVFGSIRHDANDPDTIAEDLVWSIYRDHGGNVWVGTNSGLTRLGKHPRGTRHFSFQGSAVVDLHAGPDGRMWAVTRDAGVYRNQGPDTAFDKLPLILPDGKSLEGRISQIIRDTQGRLWATSAAGLLRLDPDSGRIMGLYPLLPDDGSGASTITTLCQTDDGALWVGSRHGEYRFDTTSKRFEPAPTGSGAAGVLANFDVMTCLATPGGNLWIGGADGLVHYQPKTGSVRLYDVADGLPSPAIYSLLPDASGKIWAATGRGLARIDPKTGAIRVFGQANGLVNDEFNQLAEFAYQGVLYFGGIHGVSVVYPMHLSESTPATTVGITGYTVGGRSTKQVHQVLPSTLQVEYWQDTLSFNLAVFDYAAPGTNSFRYRLDGFDTAWHDLHDHHSVTYTNLDAGNYTLQVRGVDSNGRVTSNQANLSIEVQPPPWLSPSAWALYVACGALLLALGLHLFGVWIRRRNDLANEQRRRRWAESLRELVHDIAQLKDEQAIALRLVSQLPALIPHRHAAFYAGNDADMELITSRGFEDADTACQRQWLRQPPGRIADLCQQGHARIVDDIDGAEPRAPGTYHYLALPLHAASDRNHLLLIARQDAPFEQVEVELADILGRQVSVVLDNAELIQELARLAHTDSLTGIDNRHWFMHQASSEFQRCRRYGRPLSLLLLDVDHFKQVNDTHGHAAGDAVLATLAARCRAQLRDSDILARYGGEEFLICLPETELDKASMIAERLRDTIGASPMTTPAGPVTVTVSVGLASMTPGPGDRLDALIATADASMYAAKRDGRDCVRVNVGIGN